jgi:hypothetical protein
MISETLKNLAATLRKEAEMVTASRKTASEKIASAALGIETLRRWIA